MIGMHGFTRSRLVPALVLAVLATGMTSCSSVSGSGSGSKGSIEIGGLGELTGPKAGFGSGVMQGMQAAKTVVNNAGGVMGRKLDIVVGTDNSDPVDAIPVAQKQIQLNNVVSEVGEAGASAQAIESLYTKSKVPLFTAGGDTFFDKNTDPYVWRLTPSDSQLGVAMALYAQSKGYKRAVTMFTINAVQQALQSSAVAAYKGLGGNVLGQFNLQPDLTSYKSEVSRVVALKPDVIFVEMDPGTASVVFKNFASIGKLTTPFVGTDDMIGSSTIQAVGASTAHRILVNLEGGTFSSPAATNFLAAVKASANAAPLPNASYGYDGIIIDALAMQQAQSTNGTAVVAAIPKVTAPGGTVVYDYATGLSLLKAGKRITYVGASGPYDYNKYHNVFGPFIAVQATGSGGNYQTVSSLTAAQLQKATPAS
jgi:ABC-type branched-subunit amino acid transport system substrate-binding protein